MTTSEPATHSTTSANPPPSTQVVVESDDETAEESPPERSLLDHPDIQTALCHEVRARPEQVHAALALMEDGATVPFIARYRKEATQNLDEVQLRTLDERRRYYSDLLARRETVLSTIEGHGHLTAELRKAIEGCLDRTRLEDLYLPYRPKRRTRASMAVEKGVEPLARLLYQQSGGHTLETLHAAADAYLSEEHQLTTREEVLAAARDIVAEWIAEDAELRQLVRDLVMNEGFVRSHLREPRTPEAAAPPGAGATAAAEPARVNRRADRAAQKARERAEAVARYRSYHDFRESVRTIPSHRILAIRRAAREEILTYGIEVDHEKALSMLRPSLIVDPQSAYAEHVEAALQDAYQRLMRPSIENEAKQMLRKKADTEAIRVFSENLESLLMAPPAGPLVVLGVDPGFRTGCKLAVIDTTGQLVDHATIHPNEPRSDEKGAEKILATLLERHRVGAIAIGNGTASRETHAFVRHVISRRSLANVFSMVVNESGASVYSASDAARLEFPDLDVTVRGAVSIARRLQDPLAELVKIDPRSLGIGQYQHDIDQKRLREALYNTVESCVNHVGVDLNTASVALLRYVAGINEATAQAIVQRRDRDGAFRTRQDLLAVSGVGPKTFQQAAGFLRIRDGEVPLDNTAVHPESYLAVQRLAEFLGTQTAALLHSPDRLGTLDRAAFQEQTGTGPYTLHDILEEIARPGRDPRERFVVPEFREDVQKIEDLQVGMKLEGTVTNVANFGAFVDLGVHQDGLVHVSELSHRFVQDPRDVVKVGDIVTAYVLSVDTDRKRIALTMKAPVEEGAAPPAVRPSRRDFHGPSEQPPPYRRAAAPRPTVSGPPTAEPARASVQLGNSSGYVPGAWKRTGAPGSTPGAASARPRKGGVPAPKPAPAASPKPDGDLPKEVDERIRALQERFNRNK